MYTPVIHARRALSSSRALKMNHSKHVHAVATPPCGGFSSQSALSSKVRDGISTTAVGAAVPPSTGPVIAARAIPVKAIPVKAIPKKKALRVQQVFRLIQQQVSHRINHSGTLSLPSLFLQRRTISRWSAVVASLPSATFRSALHEEGSNPACICLRGCCC